MNIRRQIFEFLVHCQTEMHHAPNRTDVRWAFSNLTDDVDLHLEQLEREGLVELGGSDAGAISLVPTFSPVPKIWLRDSVPPGAPEAGTATRHGSIALDLRGVGVPMQADMYATEVLDDSMIDAGIERGDIAILTHAPVERGDIVAFEVDGRTVLRRYLIIAGIPHALAENARRPALCAAFDFPIHGKLWGLVRTQPGRSRKRRVTKSKSVLVRALYADRSEGPPTLEGVTSTPWDEDALLPPPPAVKPLRRRVDGGESPKKRAYASRQPAKKIPKGLPKPPRRVGLNEPTGPAYRGRAT